MDGGGQRTPPHQGIIMYENIDKGPTTLSSRFAWLRTKRAIAALAVLACAIIAIIVLVATGQFSGSQNGGSSQKSDSLVSGASSVIANGTALRIMPLGASCVKGEASTGNVGFRKGLREQLTALDNPVNMVGSERLGDMVDNDLEAYGGIKITQLHKYAQASVPEMQPNVFVINIGTNNALQYVDLDKVGGQMEDFVDYLLDASPDAVVIMSTLLTNTVPGCEPLILDMNQQFRDVFSKYEEAGKPVVLAEMHPSEGLSGRPEAGDIGKDGTHPTDAGYGKMATIFVDAIKEADSKGFLHVPVKNDIPDDGEAGRKSSSSKTTRRTTMPKRDHPLIIPRWCGA